METPGIPQQQQLTYADYEAAKDEGNLKALAIGTAAYGGFQLLMLIVQMVFMNQWMKMITSPEFFGTTTQSAQMNRMFTGIMATAITVSYVIMGLQALVSIIAAKCIHDRKGWLFVMIAAGINVINVPIGTVLSVFLFIVLSKPNIKARFNREQPAFR